MWAKGFGFGSGSYWILQRMLLILEIDTMPTSWRDSYSNCSGIRLCLRRLQLANCIYIVERHKHMRTLCRNKNCYYVFSGRCNCLDFHVVLWLLGIRGISEVWQQCRCARWEAQHRWEGHPLMGDDRSWGCQTWYNNGMPFREGVHVPLQKRKVIDSKVPW